MFAGHFGLAAAVKAKSPTVPLWALMLSTQLLDVIFVPLYLSGLESMVPVAAGYGGNVIHADYTHSLVGAIIISLIAGLLCKHFFGKKGGLMIGTVAFSHWILDLLVHRADLPLLPGNLGNFPLLGLGLWKYPAVSILLESILIAIGFIMYYRSIIAGGDRKHKTLGVVAGAIMGILLVLSLITDILGVA